MGISFVILSFVLLLQITVIALGLYFDPRSLLIRAALLIIVMTIPFVLIGIKALLFL